MIVSDYLPHEKKRQVTMKLPQLKMLLENESTSEMSQ